jgi:type II secretory pathway pseudopilin PulG
MVLMALLLTLALAGLLAMRAAEVWATTLQRDREAELLWVGDQYRQAIRRYYFNAPPGQARVLPEHLDDLTDDRRSVVGAQHLRRLYDDPITQSADWGLVMQGNRIAGVYSKSEAKPMKLTGFDAAHVGFEGRESYRDWAFVFVPPLTRRR